MLRLIGILVAATAVVAAEAQPPSQERPRDLVLETPAAAAKLPPGTVPRGYALVVGVGQYENLESSKQLQFPETDAESIYRILINHEGGSFPAENVHLLKGRQATRENILDQWARWVAWLDKYLKGAKGDGKIAND